MCLSSPKVSTPAVAPTPTPTSVGESESVAEAKTKYRAKQRAAAGYQQNILSGSAGTSDSNVSKFQSTHPRGVRREELSSGMTAHGVSIHAPTRGATHNVTQTDRIYDVSIHAPTRGATLFKRYYGRFC